MNKELPNRLKIKQMIETGSYTPQDICDELDITPAARAQYFSQLRLMKCYPVTDHNGYLHFTSEKGWKKHKNSRKKRAVQRSLKARTPDEQFAFLKNRLLKAHESWIKAEKRYDSNNSGLNYYRMKKRNADFRLAQLQIEKFAEKHGYDIDDIQSQLT